MTSLNKLMPGSSGKFSKPQGPVDAGDPIASFPAEVLEYAARHGIRTELRMAVELALRVYAPAKEVSARIQQDPDVDEQCIIVDVSVSGTVEEVRARYKEFTAKWVSMFPWEISERITVLYHID